MSTRDTITISNLEAVCIIGTLPHERTSPQRIVMRLELTCELTAAGASDDLADTVDYAALSREAVAIARDSRCRLLERLAARLAEHCLAKPGVSAVTVCIEKPDALPGGAIAAVSVTRTKT